MSRRETATGTFRTFRRMKFFAMATLDATLRSAHCESGRKIGEGP
jgi:hypothetical protein